MIVPSKNKTKKKREKKRLGWVVGVLGAKEF
jgi:ribosomal protein L32